MNTGGISLTARRSPRCGATARPGTGLHLLGDAEVAALAVAEVADHRPHRVVDLPDVLTEEGGRAYPLHVAPRG